MALTETLYSHSSIRLPSCLSPTLCIRTRTPLGQVRDAQETTGILSAQPTSQSMHYTTPMQCHAMPCQMPINMRSAPHQSIPRYYYHNHPSHRGLPRFIFDTPTPTTHPQQRRLHTSLLPALPSRVLVLHYPSPHDVVTLAPLSTSPSPPSHTPFPVPTQAARRRQIPAWYPCIPSVYCHSSTLSFLVLCAGRLVATKLVPRNRSPSPLPAPVLGAR